MVFSKVVTRLDENGKLIAGDIIFKVCGDNGRISIVIDEGTTTSADWERLLDGSLQEIPGGEISLVHDGKAVCFYGPDCDGLMTEVVLGVEACDAAIDNVRDILWKLEDIEDDKVSDSDTEIDDEEEDAVV